MDAYGFSQRLLEEQLVRQGVNEMDLPHALICEDAVTGQTTLSGPFNSGFAALVAAEADARAMRAVPDCEGFTFRIQPMHEPLAS